MTDSSSYAKLPFCSVHFSVTENASSQPGNLFRHVHAKKDSLLRFFTYHKLLSNWQKAKSRKAVKPLAWLQSLPPLVLLATTAVRGHWENVFETPILISSHSGSRTHCGEKAKSLPGAEKTNSRRPVWSATVVAVDKQFTVYYQRICKRDDQIKETVNSGGW